VRSLKFEPVLPDSVLYQCVSPSAMALISVITCPFDISITGSELVRLSTNYRLLVRIYCLISHWQVIDRLRNVKSVLGNDTDDTWQLQIQVKTCI